MTMNPRKADYDYEHEHEHGHGHEDGNIKGLAGAEVRIRV